MDAMLTALLTFLPQLLIVGAILLALLVAGFVIFPRQTMQRLALLKVAIGSFVGLKRQAKGEPDPIKRPSTPALGTLTGWLPGREPEKEPDKPDDPPSV